MKRVFEAIGMRTFTTAMLSTLSLVPMSTSANTPVKQICGAGTSFEHRRLDSVVTENICEAHSGKVMLIVNTASRCAFTDQYEGLEKLYEKYRDRGLVVIGFPSNDFGNQESGDEKSIKNFCRLNYGVSFPMYEKISIKNDNADPLYTALSSASGTKPRWNFHKYLIDRDGHVAGSYGSIVKPESRVITDTIEKLL
jgi:glutathione peroxidase